MLRAVRPCKRRRRLARKRKWRPGRSALPLGTTSRRLVIDVRPLLPLGERKSGPEATRRFPLPRFAERLAAATRYSRGDETGSEVMELFGYARDV